MVNDARFRQWVMLQIHVEAFPVERRFLAPPIDPLKDQSFGRIVESLNSSAIAYELIALGDALDRFVQKDKLKADLGRLRYFAGLTIPKAAQILNISHAWPLTTTFGP